MSRIFNEVRNLRIAISAIGSAQYQLSQKRQDALKAVQTDIIALFTNLPRGLRHLSHASLAAEGNRYLLVDLDGPEGGIVNGARTRCSLIDICKSLAGLAAWDIARDEFLGEVNEFSFRDSSFWPDWMIYSNHPQKRKVWTDGVFHSDVIVRVPISLTQRRKSLTQIALKSDSSLNFCFRPEHGPSA